MSFNKLEKSLRRDALIGTAANLSGISMDWFSSQPLSLAAGVVMTDENGHILTFDSAGNVTPAISVWGTTAPSSQPAHIADPTGGVTQDAEARTAINSILVALESYGFVASS